MPKFRTCTTLKLADGVVAAGELVEMTADEAQSLPAGTVEAVKAEAPAPTPVVPAAPKAAKEKKP